MDNYYQKLGVSTNASPEDLKKRFEKKLRKFLLFGLNRRKIRKIEILKVAFENLIDPALRNKHDLELQLYSANQQAPWRNFYENYSGQNLKEDLAFCSSILKELVEEFEGKKVIPGILFMLVGLFVGLIILLFGLLKDPILIELTGRKSSVSSVVLPQLPIFTKEEDLLSNDLTPERKQELMTILRQIDQLKPASNFPQILNSCKIHLEAVSLAEELIIKYQGLLSCLHTAAKL